VSNLQAVAPTTLTSWLVGLGDRALDEMLRPSPDSPIGTYRRSSGDLYTRS